MHVALHHQAATHGEKGRITWQGMVTQFAVGGAMVAFVSYLCSHVSTKVAALFYALPITYLPVVFYVQKTAEKEGCPKILTEYTGQNFASMLLELIFGLALYLMLKAHALKHPNEYIHGGHFTGYIVLSLLFMGVPMLFYHYWVCSGSCNSNGEFELDSEPCYFG